MRRLLATVDRAWSGWERFWFRPLPTSTLAVVRIAFGLVMLAWTFSLSPSLLAWFATRGILPAQPQSGAGAWGLLGWFPSDAAVIALFFALLLASLLLVVGFRTRLASVVVFVGLLSFSRRNPWIFNSGDLFLHVLAFYLMLAPAGESLSVDRWLKAKERFWEFPARAPWALRLVQVQLSILYVAAVWAKVRGATWNDGTAVSYAFRVGDLERFPVPDLLTDSLLVSNVLTFATLGIELALGILVWNRKLRPWVLLLGVGLHLGIDYAVRVGFFSYAIFVAYIAFIPPETMNAWILAARDRVLGSRLVRRAAPRSLEAPAGERSGS